MSASERILVLGGTSAIAQAYANELAPFGPAFVLVGRHEERLRIVSANLRVRGAVSVEIVVADLAAIDDIERVAKMIRSRFGEPEQLLLAYGLLGDQLVAERDLGAARSILTVNFISAALWLLALLSGRDLTTPLSVVVIGSVAGERGRAANGLYGAAKGGLEIFVDGLRQKYAGTAVRFLVVKPGFVDTPMTTRYVKSGPLWAPAERVARDIRRAVVRRKRVIYTPWFWRPIMAVIRLMPWFLFRRLKI